MNESSIALICKALSDPNRLKIVQILSGGEQCACKLQAAFSITQPTLSHHMKILCESGLVSARRKGKWSFYSLNCDTVAQFKFFIRGLCCREEDCSVCSKRGCAGREGSCC